MPEVPSADEAGLPGYEVRSWFGMFAPAKTPPSVVERLSREIKRASTDPKFVAALAPQGMQIIASSPDEMAQALREDSKKWGDVIRDNRSVTQRDVTRCLASPLNVGGIRYVGLHRDGLAALAGDFCDDAIRTLPA
jgi:hypothetical protein